MGEPMRWLNRLVLSAFLVWAFSAGLWPFIEHQGNWAIVQEVWYRWQGWNAGALATFAAVAAIYVARFRDEKDRSRSAIAAKVMLPDHLSNLLGYIVACQRFLQLAHRRVRGEMVDLTDVPEKPQSYEAALSEAARWGEPEFTALLGHLLAHLQVYRSRMRDLPIEIADPNAVVIPNNVTYYLIHGAVIYTELTWLLGHSRDLEPLPNVITSKDLMSSLRLNGIYSPGDFQIDEQVLERRARIETRALRKMLKSRTSWAV